MKLIKEMRSFAAAAALASSENMRVVVTAFADALANSGALGPVPDGEPCELVELYGHQKFLLGDRGICEMVNPGQYDRKVSVRIISSGDIIESEKYAVFVQPVRLVPIAEWEAEG